MAPQFRVDTEEVKWDELHQVVGTNGALRLPQMLSMLALIPSAKTNGFDIECLIKKDGSGNIINMDVWIVKCQTANDDQYVFRVDYSHTVEFQDPKVECIQGGEYVRPGILNIFKPSQPVYPGGRAIDVVAQRICNTYRLFPVAL